MPARSRRTVRWRATPAWPADGHLTGQVRRDAQCLRSGRKAIKNSRGPHLSWTVRRLPALALRGDMGRSAPLPETRHRLDRQMTDSTSTATTADSTPRNRYIDTLRAGAIVRVVVYHAFGWAWLTVALPAMGVM